MINMVFKRIPWILFALLNMSWLGKCRNTATNEKTMLDIIEHGRSNSTELSDHVVWISLDAYAAREVSASRVAVASKITSEKGDIALLRVHESQLLNISLYLNDRKEERGGFVVHNFFQEGHLYIKDIQTGEDTQFVAPEIDNEQVAKVLKKGG